MLNEHGACAELIYKNNGVKMPSKYIDFSTNTNIFKNDISIKDSDFKKLVMNYPSISSEKLKIKLSEKLKQQTEEILITNGSNEGLYLIASYFQGKNIGIVSPTYPEYERAFKSYGATIHYIDLKSNIDDIDLVVICNPNNPTGCYIPWQNLQDLIKKSKQILIDEAYIDFISNKYYKNPYVLKHREYIDFDKYKNLIISRSLTKIYSLAGIRAGYILANTKIIEKLKKRQPSWAVNGIAQKLALNCIENEMFLVETRDFYEKERIRLKKYINMEETDVNFYILKVEKAECVIKKFLEKGIVVRHTNNHVGLDGRYIRIAIRSEKENNLVIQVLKSMKI